MYKMKEEEGGGTNDEVLELLLFVIGCVCV
jgi:hypothetical protein